MREPDEVAAMLTLHGKGWGTRRIARELGVSRNTVKRWLAEDGWVAYRSPERGARLAGLEDWLKERFQRHRGNAEVIRQELAGEPGIVVSLRTVERAVEPWRRELLAEARATVRFETAPGEQLQIDFGEKRAWVGGEPVRVHLFVATLGYSRRNFAMAFDNQRQGSWLQGIEAAFAHFGGVPEQLLLDNARALVEHHDVETREVHYNERFHAFCRYWGVRPKACAPYRARTKGKDENGVGYVKGNAIAGRRFASWAALEAHLQAWMRDVADVRIHGSTGERPIDRFCAAEAAALKPLDGKPPFEQQRELSRRVASEPASRSTRTVTACPGHGSATRCGSRSPRSRCAATTASRRWRRIRKARAGANAASRAATSKASSGPGPSARAPPRCPPRSAHRRRGPSCCAR
jgi:transposase